MAKPDVEQPASTTNTPESEDSKSEEDYQALIKAIRRGDLLTIITVGKAGKVLPRKRSAQEQNTLLHVAARYANWLVALSILDFMNPTPKKPNHAAETSSHNENSSPKKTDQKGDSSSHNENPLLEVNLKNETPLHIAAKYGNMVIVYMLVSQVNETERQKLLTWKDKEDNTPLHNAVRHGHELIAQYFIDCDSSQICEPNKAGQSPLSIAVDAGLNDIARSIIRRFSPESHQEPRTEDLKEPHNWKPLLHSAIIRQNYEIMAEILKCKKELIDTNTINSLDCKERNPLHYAAASGNVKIAKHLCKLNASLVYKKNKDGQTPLHLAAKHGRQNVLKMLLQDYPDAIEMIDNQKRNILHVAAENGEVKIVSFILKLPEMVDLVNSPDKDGNTPLHLAAMELHSDVVYIFCKYMTVNIKTALEIVEWSPATEGKHIQKHLTKKALKAAYADRGYLDAEEDALEDRAKEVHSDGGRKVAEGSQLEDRPKVVLSDGALKVAEGSQLEDRAKVVHSDRAPKMAEDMDGEGGKGKEMAQTLSVMNTLVATFTFTAAFTLPGGFRSDGPDEGMAVLVRRTSFQAFVIIDTIAMTSSMTAAVIVFWSFWCSRSEYFMDSLPSAIALTWIGLVSMTLAFVTGLYVVLSDNMALAITVSSVGCALPLIFYVLAPFILLLSGQSASVNPFAFSFSMVKIVLNKPINWCFRLSKSKLFSCRITSTTTLSFAIPLFRKTLFGLIFYLIKAFLIAFSDACSRPLKKWFA